MIGHRRTGVNEAGAENPDAIRKRGIAIPQGQFEQ